MSDYYAELAGQADSARVDGWRHRLEQWLRFEVLRRALPIGDDASVVDLGSGTGQLLAYLGAERRGAYLGVDRLEHAIDRGGSSFGEEHFLHADLYDERVDERGPFDWAIAVGTLVDGTEVRSAVQRLKRLNRLVGRLHTLGRRGWALVVLDQSVLDADPVRGLEPCLMGATVAELENVLGGRSIEAAIEQHLLPSDLFVLCRREGRDSPRCEEGGRESVVRTVIDRAQSEPGGVQAAELVSFWLHLGRLDQARRALKNVPDGHPKKRLLRKRLEMERD